MTRYISLAEYFWLAEQVTGLEAAVLIKAARVDLADSALHAPQAGFGDEDFYSDVFDKAAVLTKGATLNANVAICMALATTNRWISEVPSKIVSLTAFRTGSSPTRGPLPAINMLRVFSCISR